MAYVRTTKDEYRLLALYTRSIGWEEVETADTAREIRTLKREYELNAPQYRYKTQVIRIKLSGE